MSATDELRRLLDERGVEWKAPESYDGSFEHDTIVGDYWFHEYNGKITVHGMTPEQAIAATLGAGACREVYLVEISDELLESWLPFGVYLHRETAEDCAESMRKVEDGVQRYARVTEMKVVDE